MVICMERDAFLHMVHLMPLPLTVSCFSKIGFIFLVPAHLGSPGEKAIKRCVLLTFLTKNTSDRSKIIFARPRSVLLRTQTFRSAPNGEIIIGYHLPSKTVLTAGIMTGTFVFNFVYGVIFADCNL